MAVLASVGTLTDPNGFLGAAARPDLAFAILHFKRDDEIVRRVEGVYDVYRVTSA